MKGLTYIELIVLVLFATHTALAQERRVGMHTREYLETLDDVELLVQDANAELGLQIYRERRVNYSEEEERAIWAAVRAAMEVRNHRGPLPVDSALERINATDNHGELVRVFMGLRRACERAPVSERPAIRAAFLSAWDQAPPASSAHTAGGRTDLARQHAYARLVPVLYPEEADALPILTERCLDSGMPDGMLAFCNALTTGLGPLGSLTATKIEALYADLLERKQTLDISSAEFVALSQRMHHVLGRCGTAGLDAVKRMGTEKSDEGVAALGAMKLEEAERILWDLLDNPACAHPSSQLKLLNAIYVQEASRPDSSRLQRMRAPLGALLSPPADTPSHSVGTVEQAVRLASDTGDTHYLSAIVALEQSLGASATVPANNEASVNKLHTRETLLAAIGEAKALL